MVSAVITVWYVFQHLPIGCNSKVQFNIFKCCKYMYYFKNFNNLNIKSSFWMPGLFTVKRRTNFRIDSQTDQDQNGQKPKHGPHSFIFSLKILKTIFFSLSIFLKSVRSEIVEFQFSRVNFWPMRAHRGFRIDQSELK